MIYTIPEISINGLGGTLGNPFFGGYIYNLDYQITLGNEGSSTVTVNLVSEDGTYAFTPDNLQIHQTYNISIGDALNLNMYIKKMRKKFSSKGYLLELEFMDGSFILDKYFVGLHKKHGYAPGQLDAPIMGGTYGASNPPCFIIVGHEFNPCDINNDGTVDIQDFEDPCDLCGGLQAQQQAEVKLVDCERIASHEIFDVRYNFSDLIAALQNFGFKLQNAFDPNPFYFNSNIGSLREVLSAWCHHFGWIFFWDNGTIVFRDLRTIPIVNAQIQTFCPNIEDYQEEYTLEGTFNSMILTNYSRSGFDREETCQDARYIVMPPFVAGDNSETIGTPLEIEDLDVNASSLCYYRQELRDLYVWYIDNQMNFLENVYLGNNIQDLGMNILSEAIQIDGSVATYNGGIEPTALIGGVPVPPFTDTPEVTLKQDVNFMTARFTDPVLLENRELIKNNPRFKECFIHLDNETQYKVAANLGSYFFFVVHYDHRQHEQAVQQERDFAEGFIGKFYIHLPDDTDGGFFEDSGLFVDNTCGQNLLKNDDTIKYNFLGDTGGDSLTYFNDAGLAIDGDVTTVSRLPFARYLKILINPDPATTPEETPLPFKLIVVSKGAPGFYPTPRQAQVDITEETNTVNNWLINDPLFVNQAYTFFPKAVASVMTKTGENSIRKLLGTPDDFDDHDKNKMMIMLGFKATQDMFTYTTERASNPSIKKVPPAFNGKPLNFKIDPNTGLPTEQIIYQYPNLLCSPMQNLDDQCDKVSFQTPVGTFIHYQPTDSDYACVIEKSRDAKNTIPKVETVFTSGQCAGDQNVLATDVHVHNIKDDDIRKFFKLAPSTCAYDINAILALHQNYVNNLSISQTTPLLKKIFTIDGVTISGPIPTIDQGLQGISISAGSEGIKTTYTFGTSHMLVPDDDVLNAGYFNSFIQHTTRANDTNPIPTTTAQ